MGFKGKNLFEPHKFDDFILALPLIYFPFIIFRLKLM